MLRKATCFGFIICEPISSCESETSVTIWDNFSSEKTRLTLPTRIIDIDSTEDPVVFLLDSNNLTYLYDLRTKVVEWCNPSSVELEWIKCGAEVSKIVDDISVDEQCINQFAHWDNYRCKTISKENWPQQNLLNKPYLICTAFSAFLLVNVDTVSSKKAIITRLYDSRESSKCALAAIKYNIIMVGMGKDHIVLLDELGFVWTFGTGSHGELGHGTLESETNPRLLNVFTSENIKIVSISAGAWHTVALTNEGDVYGWGWNKRGQLGYPTSEFSIQQTPHPFDLQINATHIYCNYNTTFILLSNGELCTFGEND